MSTDHQGPAPRRSLTPIERMIDEACGVPAGWKPGELISRPKEPPKEWLDSATLLLLEIAAAAKAWRRNHRKGARRLAKAVDAWRAVGG